MAMFNGKRLMVGKTMMKPTPSSRPPMVDTLWQVILIPLAQAMLMLGL